MSELKNRKLKRKKSKKTTEFGEGLGISNEDEYRYLEKTVLGIGNKIYDKSVESDSEDETSAKNKEKTFEDEKQKPAWVDEEDNDFIFNEFLAKRNKKPKVDGSGVQKHQNVMEKKFKEIMGVPKWAQLSKKSQNSHDNLSNFCGEFLQKPKFLNKESLEIEKVRNLNAKTKAEGAVISVLKFHSKSMVAMVGGNSGTVSLVQVDGEENTKLQSIKFEKYPIYSGSFMKNGDEFMIGSKYYKYFYCHDMISGKSMKIDNSKITEMTKTTYFCVSPRDDLFAVSGNTGKIYLFTVKTKEYVDCLQMNCNVSAISFNGDGSILYSHGKDGEVYAWDMESRRCIKKLMDDGCLTGTSLASSINNQFLACGSSSGVVNIYGSELLDQTTNALPLKTVYNLVTPITGLQFNTTAEILAIASSHKEKAFKLLHCPSMTVFSNFPPFHCSVKKPFCMDFSKNSGFFGIGDNNGAAHLYRLKNYGNY